MAKPSIHRTFAPIHFEDLDPHRFEDLIRELIYDFRDWQVVEATGRSGDDAGIDIRAFERVQQWEEEPDGSEASSPMDGNRWQIQCKREKQIGPSRIEKIINECITVEDPPYGFILAAPCNFSKKAYDIFRAALKAKGVMEFYLWGKAELEDQLHMPKNDRVLFTFFGISLVSKTRMRKTAIRSFTTTKNKVYKLLGFDDFRIAKILLRDVNDSHYPHEDNYPDFAMHPRWLPCDVQNHHVYGLVCCEHEYYAYYDAEKKQYDYCTTADLLYRDNPLHDMDEKYFELYHQRKDAVEEIWDFFPNRYKSKLKVFSLLRYDQIELIDEQGDILYRCPHFFVQHVNGRLFAKSFLVIGEDYEQLRVDDYANFHRIKIFDKIVDQRFSRVPITRLFQPSIIVEKLFNDSRGDLNTIYYTNGQYDFLEIGNVTQVQLNNNKEPFYLLITFKETIVFSNEGTHHALPYAIRHQLPDVKEGDQVHALEFKKLYAHQLNKHAKVKTDQ